MHLRAACYAVLLLVAACSLREVVAADIDTAQAAQDASTVEAVLRLSNFDLNSSLPSKQRSSGTCANRGTDRYFQLIAKFKLRELSGDLAETAIARPGETAGVAAARTLEQLGDRKLLEAAVADSDPQRGTGAALALGHIGDEFAIQFLAKSLGDRKLATAVRAAAARSMAKNRSGEANLAGLVSAGTLPTDLQFTVANLLHASSIASIRKIAAQHLPLPAAAAGTPLPPIAELVHRSGDPQLGKTVFATKGTCANCHTIASVGKDVGPDLSEIGSKLSKEALYVAILDPSAGISHNYENYEVVTLEGQIATGLLVSRTDDEVRIKNAEAVELTFSSEEIDEFNRLELSLMPNGLQQNLSVEELVGLVQYLTTLKQATAAGP